MIGLASKVLSLLSIMILAIPAFHVARYGALLYKLSSLQSTSSQEIEIIGIAQAELEAQRDRWTPLYSFLLVSGTVIAFIAGALDLSDAYSTFHEEKSLPSVQIDIDKTAG